MMIRYSLLLSMALCAVAFAQSQPASEPPLNYNDETEASAALLFLDLYNQGLAGGNTGVCVDLDYDIEGKPQFKAAFDTSAFVTGKSELNKGGLAGQGFDSENFKKLVDALAKVQNGKVNASIDGYADGQHYKSAPPFSVEESIKKNEKLSADRANVIADILRTNPNLNIASVKGHASPEWERTYPGMNDGLNCPTRRKVVVTFDQPTPQVKSELTGDFFRAPESMDKTVKAKVKKEFDNDVRNARESLGVSMHRRTVFSKRAPRGDVEKIYKKLMADKKLNPKCDLPPFKQITMAMIENEITRITGEHKSRKKEEIIEAWVDESGFKMKDISGGRSALQEGCLEPSKELTASMQSSVQDYALSGSSFMSAAKLKTNNGNVTVGFDVNSLQPQKVPSGEHKGETLRGFYCKACGNGLFFHEDKAHKGQYKPEYIDRIVRFEDGKNEEKDRAKFMTNLNAVSDADPFSIASYVKPRLFVVKNCKDCKCDHTSLIRAKDASVITFDPIAGGPTSAQIPASEFESACVIRPPVHHACNVDPNKNKGNDKSSFKQKLTYESSLQNLKFSADNMPELLKNVGNACPANLKGKTTDEKIRNVMCSADQLKQLPSENEKEDCAEFDAKKAR